MLVSFNVSYHTQWGDTIWLSMSEDSSHWQVYAMEYAADGRWFLTLDLPDEISQIEYQYELRRGEHVETRGWGSARRLKLKKSYTHYTLQDHWQEIPRDKHLFSSPFVNTFFRRPDESRGRTKTPKQAVTIRVFAPAVKSEESLCLLGSSPELGQWESERALVMSSADFPVWSITLDAEALRDGDTYKFAIMQNGFITEWEQGDNRLWHFGTMERGGHFVLSGLHFRGGEIAWRGAGVAIPVFSLRSKHSAGIGDFADLRAFADWASMTGQCVIQILPINDTTQTETWHDSYPYKSISTFALHPLYLSLNDMGTLTDTDLAREIHQEAKRLNMLEQLDYEGVGRLKWRFFKAIYKQNGKKTLASKAYRTFFEANKDWLVPYVAFCYLRDVNGTAVFSKWGRWSKYDEKAVKKLLDPANKDYDRVAIYLFLQYHLDAQLHAAAEYAHSKGVVLKGDIPIGISRDSVEAWTEPHLFNMTGQAGAPPDDFSVMGQNWGFPTYNWDAMARDGYAWWKRRFQKMADYFDLYRIDHILGFFRIWEIPLDSVQGLLGHFNPALPFSRMELSNWGMPMQDERYLEPFIHYDFLGDFFGEYRQQAMEFLVDKGCGMFSLAEKFNTQRKVQKYFEGKDDPRSERLRDGLYGLINEVLFIRDAHNGDMFHPRITAQYTKSFQWLSEWEKARFNDLYIHFFYKRHNDFWAALAMEKLPALIDSTNMLCCAEDLGMIPDCVAKVMSDLSIITLEIQRMPKDPTQLFGQTNHYPYLSVCTTSTHDMSPIRLWWEEDPAKTQLYYNNVMWWHGAAPAEASGQICQAILGNHLLAPSILTILPLQDWLSMDEEVRIAQPAAERINVPSNPDHYWRYRMHLTIEALEDNCSLSQNIHQMIKGSYR